MICLPLEALQVPPHLEAIMPCLDDNQKIHRVVLSHPACISRNRAMATTDIAMRETNSMYVGTGANLEAKLSISHLVFGPPLDNRKGLRA